MSLCMRHKHLLPELWVFSVLLGENQDSLGLLMLIVYSQFTLREDRCSAEMGLKEDFAT